MKGIVKLFNFFVALCIIILILLLFWFLIAKYVRNTSAMSTFSYMWSTMGGWWSSLSGWVASVFEGA